MQWLIQIDTHSRRAAEQAHLTAETFLKLCNFITRPVELEARRQLSAAACLSVSIIKNYVPLQPV